MDSVSRPSPPRSLVRAGLAATVVACLLLLGHAMVTAGGGGSAVVEQREIDGDPGAWVVVTAHGDTTVSKIAAYGPGGELRYVNATHDRYFDVDPVPGTAHTVEYVAADHIYGPPCVPTASCTRNVVERVNLSTGTVTRVYDRITPDVHNSRWHDVDRVAADRLLVADIDRHRAYVVNTTTGIVSWEWDAQSAFSVGDGGNYPNGEPRKQSDWTHVNDVERLDDGRVMVSVRNFDQVVFVDPTAGVRPSWTLGSDDSHDVLYEQHNPDYIPADRGGPAVLVSDSHNNRVVEYRRVDGGWERSWSWRDATLTWPRDADRLPDGHTLVVDSGADRVLEVDREGNVVWRATVDTPYDAERLDTGDESAGGPSARAAGLASATATGDGGDGGSSSPSLNRRFWLFVRSVVPSRVTAAVLYVLPPWVRFAELTALAVLGATTATWASLEYRWSNYAVAVGRPVSIRTDE